MRSTSPSAVWVNSRDEGRVVHGQQRSTPERAAAVAALLARKLGWETAAGPTAPAPSPPRDDAPPGDVARRSPASIPDSSTSVRGGAGFASASPATFFAGRPSNDAEQDAAYDDAIMAFAQEAQLRDFLAANLHRIPVAGRRLRVYRDATGRRGVEYPTQVGPIDLLATDEDGSFFVFELKLGRGPDSAVGQLTRYMGWIRENLARGHEVRGVIVARFIGDKARYAASEVKNAVLLEYEIDFRVREVGRGARAG